MSDIEKKAKAFDILKEKLKVKKGSLFEYIWLEDIYSGDIPDENFELLKEMIKED